MQECLFRGMVSPEQDPENRPLGERVFNVLVETLPSAEKLAPSGLAIQLAAILPRLSDQYERETERGAARQCAETIKEWRQRAKTAERNSQAAEHLEMMMSLYAAGNYKQGSANWLGAVCKYLHEFDPQESL